MTLNISLTPLSEARLRGLAERAGTDIDHFVSQLIERVTADGDENPSDVAGSPHVRPNVRSMGLAKGTFEVPGSFFEPLPTDMLESFEGVLK